MIKTISNVNQNVINQLNAHEESDLRTFGHPLLEESASKLLRTMLASGHNFGIIFLGTKIYIANSYNDLIPELENMEPEEYIYIELTNDPTHCDICNEQCNDLIYNEALNIHYCDTDSCCEQVNNLIKETVMLKLDGFKHVSTEGVSNFVCLMENDGTIGMLWDMSNQVRIDALMNTHNFDMTGYIKSLGYPDTESAEFCEVMSELHDELCEARFALEFAFINGIDEIVNPSSGRAIYGIHSVVHTEWSPNVYYPLVEKKRYELMEGDGALSQFVMDTTPERAVTITIHATGDGYETQEMKVKICGAEMYNALLDMIDDMREFYTEIYAIVE